MKNLISLILLSLILFAACKKSSVGGGGGNQPGNALIRIQEGVDANITNDTVYLLTYNSSGQLTVLLDSLYQDSLVATYSGGKLTAVNDVGAFSLGNSSFTYDGNGLLTEIDCSVAGSNEKYTFEYTGGIVSKKSYFSDFGLGGAQQLYSYDVYTVTNGNITDMKDYNAASNLNFESTFTYGTQSNPNTFKTLGLFNFGNRLGTQDIIGYETYFNKNILTGFAISGLNASATNTFNSQQLPTKIVMNDQYNQWLLTWQLSYK